MNFLRCSSKLSHSSGLKLFFNSRNVLMHSSEGLGASGCLIRMFSKKMSLFSLFGTWAPEASPSSMMKPYSLESLNEVVCVRDARLAWTLRIHFVLIGSIVLDRVVRIVIRIFDIVLLM